MEKMIAIKEVPHFTMVVLHEGKLYIRAPEGLMATRPDDRDMKFWLANSKDVIQISENGGVTDATIVIVVCEKIICAKRDY